MKTFLSTAAGLLLALSASAQIPHVGVEAGVNFSNTTFNFDSRLTGDESESGDYRLGLKIGALLDYRLSRGFYFQPGLYVSQKGSEEYTNDPNRDIRINYLEVPFNFLLKAGTGRTGRFFFGAGPYVALAFGGETEFFGDEEDLEIGNDNGDRISRLDAGVNATTGYEFPGGLFFRANAALGLSNALSEDQVDVLERAPNFLDDVALRNTALSLTLGYFFNR